jgi:hypothetical protein
MLELTFNLQQRTCYDAQQLLVLYRRFRQYVCVQGLFSDREARALTPTCRTPVQSFGGGGQLLHTGSDALPQMARRTTSRNLGLRCVSMDLQRVMPEVRWADQMHAVEVGEDVGGSKARLARRASSSNRAGLDLEASLSNLSDNLMCHIQQNTGRLHAEQETQVLSPPHSPLTPLYG